MRVILSGYNFDADLIKELKEKAGWQRDNITPETLSAAYARISRDPRDIEVLRREAREEVDRARRSNETIIFGLGHSSVAEHAYFNFDVIGLSRLAVEHVQKFRFASFTEKSQRYIRLDDDYVIPREIVEAGFEKKFCDIIKAQNEAYSTLYEVLLENFLKKHSKTAESRNGRKMVEGWAKEDARYVVSMACESQFGMSINARNLENMLRQLANSELEEVRVLSQNIFDLVKDLSPSIIKYVEPTEYDRFADAELDEMLCSIPFEEKICEDSSEVKLISCTPDPDREIAKIAVSAVKNIDIDQAAYFIDSVDDETLGRILKQCLKYRMPYDSVKRYFEFSDALFELTVSSSNYAQLKRHRISSIITRPYNTDLGYTVPESILETGMENKFRDIMKNTEDVFCEMSDLIPVHAAYLLTNAHRRKVILRMNFRELYHFISLRLDEHAQWDIRKTAKLMMDELKKKAPHSTAMMCGKSSFDSTKKSVYG